METIRSDSIDRVLADILYGTTQCKWNGIIDLNLMWKHLKKITKPNGVIILTAQTPSPFDKILGNSNISMLKYEQIWENISVTGHSLCPVHDDLKGQIIIEFFYSRF